MAMKRMVVELGMRTDIRGTDYTKAAVRALRDALWHNSLNVAAALGKPTDSMFVEVLIGVPKPERVNKEFIDRLRDAGFAEFHVWTVNDPKVARFYRDLGVASITTDRPEWLREQLASSSKTRWRGPGAP